MKSVIWIFMDKDLEDAIERLSKSGCVEDQVNMEILRYWCDRIHCDDTVANRAFRKLVHELVFEDSNDDSVE